MSHRCCWLLSPISQSLSDFPSRAAWPPAWSPGEGHRLDNNHKIITFWAEMACVGRKQVVSGVLLANIFSLEAGKLSLRYSQQHWLLVVTLAHSFMICLTSRLNIDIRAAHYFMVTAHWGTFVVMHTAGVWLRMLRKVTEDYDRWMYLSEEPAPGTILSVIWSSLTWHPGTLEGSENYLPQQLECKQSASLLLRKG